MWPDRIARDLVEPSSFAHNVHMAPYQSAIRLAGYNDPFSAIGQEHQPARSVRQSSLKVDLLT
jgi:hypothetical protein